MFGFDFLKIVDALVLYGISISNAILSKNKHVKPFKSSLPLDADEYFNQPHDSKNQQQVQCTQFLASYVLIKQHLHVYTSK